MNIPRLTDYEPLNRELQTLGEEPRPELQPLIQENRPLKLTVGLVGQLSTLHFVDDDAFKTPLPDDHVEVAVETNALNLKSVLLIAFSPGSKVEILT